MTMASSRSNAAESNETQSVGLLRCRSHSTMKRNNKNSLISAATTPLSISDRLSKLSPYAITPTQLNEPLQLSLPFFLLSFRASVAEVIDPEFFQTLFENIIESPCPTAFKKNSSWKIGPWDCGVGASPKSSSREWCSSQEDPRHNKIPGSTPP